MGAVAICGGSRAFGVVSRYLKDRCAASTLVPLAGTNRQMKQRENQYCLILRLLVNFFISLIVFWLVSFKIYI